METGEDWRGHGREWGMFFEFESRGPVAARQALTHCDDDARDVRMRRQE